MTKANASKRYDKEFKLGAVKLVLEEGKTVAEVVESLGVSEPSLRQWIKQYRQDKDEAFPGSGKLKAQDEELRRLKEELRVTRMERDLLKKTLPLFAERLK